jgi:multiple sugar transport system permease protein
MSQRIEQLRTTAPPRRSLSRRARREAIDGYLMLLPTIVGVAIFFAVPLGISLYLSFTDSRLFGDPNFVGGQNYSRAIGDPKFRLALLNTVWFTLGTMLLSVPPALGLALLLNQQIRGRAFFRALFFLPVVASVVGISLVWRYLLDTDYGVVNYVLRPIFQLFGVDPINWLTDPNVALWSVIVVVAWRTIGYNLVIFLAGLQGIPRQLYEAASIDGANRWQQFRAITLPMLSPTTFFIVVTTLINCLQIFAEPYALGVTRSGSAGPADSMLTIVFYLYQEGFGSFRMGYASALAWLLFVIIMVITVIQFRVSNRWVHYD